MIWITLLVVFAACVLTFVLATALTVRAFPAICARMSEAQRFEFNRRVAQRRVSK